MATDGLIGMNSKLLKLCTSKKGLDQGRFSADSFDSIPEFDTQMREIDATHITPLDPFEVGPQSLTRIELGRIGREPLQMEAVRCAVPQKSLDYVTTVDRRPIPNDD
jgi:hypothetical protein